MKASYHCAVMLICIFAGAHVTLKVLLCSGSDSLVSLTFLQHSTIFYDCKTIFHKKAVVLQYFFLNKL